MVFNAKKQTCKQKNSHIEDKHNFLKFQNVKASKIYTNWHK